MFNFGTRKVTRQGGSFLISLPMQWMQDIGTDMELVNVEMDIDKSLRIAPAHPAKNEPEQSASSESYFGLKK